MEEKSESLKRLLETVKETEDKKKESQTNAEERTKRINEATTKFKTDCASLTSLVEVNYMRSILKIFKELGFAGRIMDIAEIRKALQNKSKILSNEKGIYIQTSPELGFIVGCNLSSMKLYTYLYSHPNKPSEENEFDMTDITEDFIIELVTAFYKKINTK